MHVEEARKRLGDLSKSIRKQIQAFENETGLEVSTLDLRRAPTIGAASSVYNVEIIANARADYGL